MKRLELVLATTSFGARWRSNETTGGRNGNVPIPRLEGLGKRGGDCSVEQGKAVGTLNWKMVL